MQSLGCTAIGRKPADVDALARLEGLGFDRALAVQALLQVWHWPMEEMEYIWTGVIICCHARSSGLAACAVLQALSLD